MTQNLKAPQMGGPCNSVKHSKFSFIPRQVATIFEYWHNHIATASMVSKATGVPHKNICRYKRDLEKSGRLFELNKAICAHTGFPAWYCTTNKKLAEAYACNQMSEYGKNADAVIEKIEQINPGEVGKNA